jgi:hypothetical protein
LPELLATTFDVVVEGETYTFKIPTIKYRMEVSGKAASIRNRAYPQGQMQEQLGIADWTSVNFSRYCAVLELYLVKATTPWPFGTEDVNAIDLTKPPVVDFEKFPSDRDDTVEAVGMAFETERARFREGRTADRRPAGT